MESRKPCPFCGSSAFEITQNINDHQHTWVQCASKACGASANPQSWERRMQPEAALKTDPTEAMIDAGADAFLAAKDEWQKAQPKGYGAFCPLMVTLRAAYKAMQEVSPK